MQIVELIRDLKPASVICPGAMVIWSKMTMAKISKKAWSNGQNFDHDHGQNPNFIMVVMVNLKFYFKIQPKNYPF